MEQSVKKIGRAVAYGHSIRSRGNKRELTLDSLLTELSPYPTVVIPVGKDGSTSHAICVVDDIIFDSTEANALYLKEESLNHICGREGIHGIHKAYRFGTSIGCKHWKREVFHNWS